MSSDKATTAPAVLGKTTDALVYYAIKLRQSAGLTRWALYELIRGKLEVVWHDDAAAPLLPHQVAVLRESPLPNYHFRVSGHGINHLHELAYGLALHYGRTVSIYELTGCSPHATTARPREVRP